MQVSEWPYCSNKSLSPLLSCSRHGFVAAASFNLLTIYQNMKNGLKPISSSKSFENTITTISWCNFYDSESVMPLFLLVGFDNGNTIIFDIPKFIIISTFSLSESAITSSEWSNLYSNHFFIGCSNGDLISAYLVKSTENDADLSVVVSWINSCIFPIEQLHINHNDCQMLMVASNQGKFAIYDQIYDDTPMRLFTGTFEEDEDSHKNTSTAQNAASVSTSNNNFNSLSNNPNSMPSSAFFDVNNQKCFVQCGFHPHINDIFYFATQTRIFYGFIKEQTTVALFPSSTFTKLVGVFFPPSDENAIIVIQRPSILLLSYTIDKSWKRLCEIPNYMSGAVSFADCKFEKNSFIVASRGNNLSIVKFYRRKLFYVSFMRNIVSKPSKIAINNSFYAFIVKNPKSYSMNHNINNNFFLYLAPQLTCMTNLCLVYNITLNNNYKCNYYSTSNSSSIGRVSNEIMFITQIEWISDTDLIFAARCEENKHKLFFFNYKRRELLSILKPQLEFMFLERPIDPHQSNARPISAITKSNNESQNNSDNSNINLFETLMEEVGINVGSTSSSNLLLSSNLSGPIYASSTYIISPSNFQNPAFSAYYSTLINNNLSIRLHVHRNQKYFATTIGNYALEFFVVTQSKNPKPLLFDNSSVIILPEPAAVSFIDDSNDDCKLAIFYKNRIDICSITTSMSTPPSPRSSITSQPTMLFQLINSYEYHTELKSIPMLAHSFSEFFHIIVLETGEIEIIKIKSNISTNKKSSTKESRKMSVDSVDNDNSTRKISVDSNSENITDNPVLDQHENNEEFSAYIEILGKMAKVSCLRVSSDGSTCMVIGKQPKNENVAFITLSKSGKSKISFPKEKLRMKRCDYVSNSVIFANIFGSRCFTFCNIEDRNPIDTPHHEVKVTSESIEMLKTQIINELKDKSGTKRDVFASFLSYDSPTLNSISASLAMRKSTSFTSFSSSFGSEEIDISSSFTTNEEIDISSSSDEIELIEQTDSNQKEIKKEKSIKKEGRSSEYDESEYDDDDDDDDDNSKNEKHNKTPESQLKARKSPSKNLKLVSSNANSELDSSSNSVIRSSQVDLSSSSVNAATSTLTNEQQKLMQQLKLKPSSSSPIPQSSDFLRTNETFVDVSLVSYLADRNGLFYLSDLLQSVGQRYDPLCYGINLNDNYLIYYLRSLAEMLGESQPQPLNRRQAIYQKLSNDFDGTLSRLLTVGQTEESNHTKNMLKIALSNLELNEENFQMMLDVLLESGLDEDATDILFFSGNYNYRSVDRFITAGEMEFAIIATRLLLKPNENDDDDAKEKKEKEMEKAISLIVNFFNEHKRKHQIVPFLLGMRKFEEAAKYLDKYGERICASVIRSLVIVPEYNNSNGKVLLDYSKLPTS